MEFDVWFSQTIKPLDTIDLIDRTVLRNLLAQAYDLGYEAGHADGTREAATPEED